MKSNDSPVIPDGGEGGGETSDIPGLPSGNTSREKERKRDIGRGEKRKGDTGREEKT